MQFFAYMAVATVTLTLNGAVAWIVSQVGQSAKHSPNNPNSATQCVYLPAAYITEYFGLSWTGCGNGNEFYINAASNYPSRFTAIQNTSGFVPQRGDIISLVGSDTQYGHAALVKAVSSGNVTIAEQWSTSNTVKEATFAITNNSSNRRFIIGAARPLF